MPKLKKKFKKYLESKELAPTAIKESIDKVLRRFLTEPNSIDLECLRNDFYTLFKVSDMMDELK